jgi:hypothetical protein
LQHSLFWEFAVEGSVACGAAAATSLAGSDLEELPQH